MRKTHSRGRSSGLFPEVVMLRLAVVTVAGNSTPAGLAGASQHSRCPVISPVVISPVIFRVMAYTFTLVPEGDSGGQRVHDTPCEGSEQ